MNTCRRPSRRLAVLAAASVVVWPVTLAAQRVRTIGGPARGDTVAACLTDSVRDAAVAAFNNPNALRFYEGAGAVVARNNIQLNSLAVVGGKVLIEGTVRGDVILFNGDLRLTTVGRVEGRIMVLGGHAQIDLGANFNGPVVQCTEFVPIVRQTDGTIAVYRQRRTLANLATDGTSFMLGPVQTTLQADAGTYNRVEGLPIKFGPRFRWQANERTKMELELAGILRTSNDMSNDHATFGWTGRLAATRTTPFPLTVGLEGGAVIAPTFDRPFSPIESGLGAFVLRRDYRDWYATTGGGLFASATFGSTTLTASWHLARERSVFAGDPFSLLRNAETWRANPLIDDGKYRTLALRTVWDRRDDPEDPSNGWYLRAEARHVSSDDLSPLVLPASIRNGMPVSGYAATEIDFDLRRYFRFDPRLGLTLRVVGGGALGGDPLLVQHRRAIGGADPLPGYGFRSLNCDRRRRPDLATPALCDRMMAVQAEVRRLVNLNLGTRIAGFPVGIQRPDLVVFGDAGSAWLVGDIAGRVPGNRIQALREWRSDIGVGLDGGSLGFYLAKSLTDDEPLRFVLRLTARY